MILHFILHITGGDNGATVWYLEESGFVGLLFYCGVAIKWYQHSRCHVSACHKHGKYPFHHYKLCKQHHPEVPAGDITQEHIMKQHKLFNK